VDHRAGALAVPPDELAAENPWPRGIVDGPDLPATGRQRLCPESMQDEHQTPTGSAPVNDPPMDIGEDAQEGGGVYQERVA
jgi:hypothetical protein